MEVPKMNALVATDLFLFSSLSTPADLDAIRDQIRKAVPRIRELGNWPEWIDDKTLFDRVPNMLGARSGFDAGIACALDLIPREKQRLSAVLHAAYTEAAVEQVRAEWDDITAHSETTWWLAASSLCKESGVNYDQFGSQLHEFHAMTESADLREVAARRARRDMSQSFQLVGGIPFVIHDGGLQGAYISGYDWGVQYAEEYGLFFIGTFRESLGLEDFPFSKQVDADGKAMSGPVHGSRQFVKVCSFQELDAATRFVRTHLGPPKK